ncbi:MAG: FkbM family methyltransferase [Ignisphaera sp.]
MFNRLMTLLALLKGYGFKQTSSILLTKVTGINTLIYISGNLWTKIDKSNLSNTISLLLYLHKLRGQYILQDRKIIIFVPSYKKIINIDKFTVKDLDELHVLTLAHRFNIEVKTLDDKHLLSINKCENLKFIIRRDSILSDILGAPLLFYDEPQEYEWFNNILKPGDIFIDVGAYIGGYSARACKRKVKVYSIEPDKENYSLLLRNLEINQCTDYHVYRCAAHSEDGEIQLYDFGSPDTYSTIIMKGRNGMPCGSIKDYITSQKLDTLLSDIGNIKLLKIDVEGAELSVLKGAKEVLKKTQYIMIEVWPHTRNKILKLLKMSDFKLLSSRKYVPPTINMLFVHK